MALSIRRFFKPLVIKALALLTVFAMVVWQLPNEPARVARAGNITSASWTLSNTTENSTGVTYTHTFTTASAIPASGIINIEVRLAPGPINPLPDFSKATKVAAGSTGALVDRPVTQFGGGNNVTLQISNGATSIPAGTVTIKLANVTNPSVGGVFVTNTSTKTSSFTAIDGTQGSPDGNGKLTVGTVKLSGKITDATTGSGVEGVRLEVHPGPSSSTFGFWQTTTDSSGNYSFAGLSNGDFVFEMSPGVDPGSKNATTISQYSRFDPVNVTISATAQTINKALAKAQKIITGKVVYAGTSNPVAGAQVNAGGMGSFAFGQTGSDGTFTIRLAISGPVFVMISPPFGPPPGQNGPPSTQANDFGSVSRQISLVKPINEAETFDMKNVEVPKADATVTGKIVNPDGSAASGGAGLMNFRQHSFTPLQLGSDGTFSGKVVSGSKFKIDSFDSTGKYSMPKTEFTAKKGTNDLGTIKKLENTKTITIQAVSIYGGTETNIDQAQAMVFPKEEGPPYFATISNGTGTVKVPDTDAEYRAGVLPNGSFGGGPGGGPGGGEKKAVWLPYLIGIAQAQSAAPPAGNAQLFPVDGFKKAKAGDTLKFRFDKADKSLKVRTVDGDGKLVTDGAFADISTASGAHFGCPTAGGLGTCYVIKGDLQGRVMFPPDSNFAGKTKKFTVTDDGQTVDLTVAKKTVTITGEVQDGSNSNVVIKDATLMINVGAFGQGVFSIGQYNPDTGKYTVKVPADTKVRLGVMAGMPGETIAKGGYVPNISPTELSGKDNETVTKNITLSKVDAVIKGTVKKSDGTAVEGATVSASNTLADVITQEGGPGPGPGGPRPGEGGPEFGFSAVTDSTGAYEIPVAPDKYALAVKASSGLFPTSTYEAEPKSGETKTIDVVLAVADATLKIDVNKADGTDLNSAVAQIFDDKARVTLSVTDGSTSDLDGKTNGVVEIKVPSGTTYTIQAGEDFPDTGKVEESGYKKVIPNSNSTNDISLSTTTQTSAIEQPTTAEASSSSTTAIALADGNTLGLPAGVLSSSNSSSSNSSSSSSGNPVVNVSEIKADLPETKADTPIGAGLSINATDSSGNAITSFSGGQASIEMHYKDSDVPTGVKEENLTVKSFNEQTGAYEALSGCGVDTTNNVISCTTSHFTDFAIVATTDTTAPADPTSGKATVSTGKVSLSWTNPTDSDLDHINIYRSTSTDSIGDKLASTSSKDTTSYDDTITEKGTYYYTLKAVDASSNESPGTDQIKAVVTAVKTLPKTGRGHNPYGEAALALIFGSALALYAVRRYGYATRSN